VKGSTARSRIHRNLDVDFMFKALMKTKGLSNIKLRDKIDPRRNIEGVAEHMEVFADNDPTADIICSAKRGKKTGLSPSMIGDKNG
jgi:hypothetical protein